MSSFLSITAALMQVAETIANSILIGMVRTTWQAILENIFSTLNEIFMIRQVREGSGMFMHFSYVDGN